MANKKTRYEYALICPILKTASNYITTECMEKNCAWWNTKNKECAILTISYRLCEITTGELEQRKY